MMQNTHTFGIENTKIPGTEKVFGPQFAGAFTIRQPSLADKVAIATKKLATLSTHGPISPELVSESLGLTCYIFACLSTITVGELPAWFNPEKIFSGTEEAAIFAVWTEVSQWLKETFPD